MIMNQYENYDVPQTREERFKLLESAVATLKQEFIGLDNIIDQLRDSITSWYITPEVIRRPVIVSLWGMTGTGKSSVVNRLVELLKIDNQTLYFDCGKEAEESGRGNIVSSVCSQLGIDEAVDNKDTHSLVFIFDEFQYAKTLNENHEEVNKPSLRPIWKILDDGKIDYNDSSDYYYECFLRDMEDFEQLAKEFPDIKLKNITISDPQDVKTVLEHVGCFLWPERELPEFKISGDAPNPSDHPYYNREATESENPFRPLTVLRNRNLGSVVKRLNLVEKDLGIKFYKDLYKAKTLGELYSLIEKVISISSVEKIIDCSRSLVFVVGNLDEAYSVGDDLNPDMDADTFRDITEKVSVSDIKIALKKRFRDEQIARFGNNLLKYPTLGRDHFKKIIEKEVKRLVQDFNKEVDPISIKISPEIYELLYSEGVYPTQGVRPVFTSINTILTPFFSKIIIEKKTENKEVLITLENPEDCTEKEFKLDKTVIRLLFDDQRIIDTEYPLTLGQLRNPSRRKTRYCCAVHELGHAIMMGIRTGKLPKKIVAVSTDSGGFCDTYDPEKEHEIETKRDIDNRMMIALGGYLAERIIFGDDCDDMRLMGSSSDITESWDSFIDIAMTCGYYRPVSFTSIASESNNGTPNGIDYKLPVKYNGEEISLELAIKNTFDNFIEETRNLLWGEKVLLKKAALWLGEHGSMTSDKFEEFIKEYGNNINLESMARTRKTYSSDYYLGILSK